MVQAGASWQFFHFVETHNVVGAVQASDALYPRVGPIVVPCTYHKRQSNDAQDAQIHGFD